MSADKPQQDCNKFSKLKRHEKNYFTLLLHLFIVGCQRESVFSATDDQSVATTQSEGTTAVSPALATKAATLFFAEQTPQGKSTPKTIASIRTLFAEDGTPSMYVINYAQGGFVIVSATKEYFPILAYSDENQFELNPQNGGATDWVNQTQYAINHSNELPDSIQSKIFAIWQHYDPQPQTTKGAASKASAEENTAFRNRINELRGIDPWYRVYSLTDCPRDIFIGGDINTYNNLCSNADNFRSPREYTIVAVKKADSFNKIGPMLTTKWHQRANYNNMSSPGSPAGCVAIAMAQIMKYHKHPQHFDWNGMPDDYGTASTQSLIKDIGAKVHMIYTSTAGSSTTGNARNAFANNYGYNATLKAYQSHEVQQELSRNRPVYMGGFTANGNGHDWVVDGIDTHTYLNEYFVEYRFGGPGYYYYSTPEGPSVDAPTSVGYSFIYVHMNLGWGGDCDGWYAPTNTFFQTSSGAQYDYQYGKEVIFVSPK